MFLVVVVAAAAVARCRGGFDLSEDKSSRKRRKSRKSRKAKTRTTKAQRPLVEIFSISLMRGCLRTTQQLETTAYSTTNIDFGDFLQFLHTVKIMMRLSVAG